LMFFPYIFRLNFLRSEGALFPHNAWSGLNLMPISIRITVLYYSAVSILVCIAS
jgi:hypothetical protein